MLFDMALNLKTQIRCFAAILVVLALPANLAQATLYRYIGCSANDTITPVPPYNPVPGGGNQTLTDGGVAYYVAYKRDIVGNTNGEAQAVEPPTISKAHYVSPPASLHFKMNATTNAHGGEKSFIDVCSGNNDSFAIGDGQTAAEKFWVYIPSNFEAPGTKTMLMETWNNNAGAILYMTNGQSAWLAQIISTNGGGAYFGGKFTVGWHKFVIQVTMSYSAPAGRVTVWCDNASYAAPTLDITNVYVGMPSSRKNYFEAGLYRGYRSYNITHEIWMDDIKYGDAFADVNPDTSPVLVPGDYWGGGGADSTFTK